MSSLALWPRRDLGGGQPWRLPIGRTACGGARRCEAPPPWWARVAAAGATARAWACAAPRAASWAREAASRSRAASSAHLPQAPRRLRLPPSRRWRLMLDPARRGALARVAGHFSWALGNACPCVRSAQRSADVKRGEHVRRQQQRAAARDTRWERWRPRRGAAGCAFARALVPRRQFARTSKSDAVALSTSGGGSCAASPGGSRAACGGATGVNAREGAMWARGARRLSRCRARRLGQRLRGEAARGGEASGEGEWRERRWMALGS